MTQEAFPEIQAAAEALQVRIALTETEIAEIKESMKPRRSSFDLGEKLSAHSIQNGTRLKKRLAAA
jgi:hypothetical protein